MNPDLPDAQQVFAEAMLLKDPAQRRACVDRLCGDNAALREEVESLLRAHEQAGDFLRRTMKLTEADFVSEKTGAKIGRYKLLEQIGEGGFGTVWMAEQEEPVRRRVALKIIKAGMDTREVVARFEAERQALALMDHPNIARVFDGGATETGRPYFVMELVRGVRITDYCEENKLSIPERLELFLQVCAAVQHAHQKGIIHRDLKPSNVLVSVQDDRPVPKVIDFGIAKATAQRLTDKTVFTRFQQVIGTPAYMSPEQAGSNREDIDTRSDIYSLGVLLYELLTGQTPFEMRKLMEVGLEAVLKTIREEEPPKPSTRLTTLTKEELTGAATRRRIAPDKLGKLVRGELDWIVMKALEKERARRYESASAFAEDLRRHLRQEPVVAAPPSKAYRLRRFARRNKVALTTASTIAALLVVGVAVSTWEAVRATRAERTQNSLRQQAEANEQRAKQAQANEATMRQRAEAGEKNAQRLLYVANLNLVQQAWEQNDVARVRQLLEETATYPEHGFEWYYWQRQTHLELMTLRGHTRPVYAVAFSLDGQRIATGSQDQTAKVWDAASGKELVALKGLTGWIRSVAFSPDGQRIVTGSEDGTAKVCEAASGRELLALKGHGGRFGRMVVSVAFSPDGQRIVTGSQDQTAKVWDAASGKELLTLKGHSDYIRSVAFSPDGQRIVTGSHDQTAKVWDAASGQELLTLKGHSAFVLSVAFSPDGRRIVTGSTDQTAKVWEATSGQELLTLRGHSDLVPSVAFSPDGQRIVTGSADASAKMWDAASGKELLTVRGHNQMIWSVAFSPDGQRIVTGSQDQTAKVWDVADRKDLVALKGHRDRITSVVFSPDSQRVVTGSADKTAKVWDAASGKELLTLKGHTDTVSVMAFSPDSQRIVTGCHDETAKVWEATSGKELLTLKGHSNQITSVAFSPDGRRIVTGGGNRPKVWDAATGKELLTLMGHAQNVYPVAFSPDGQRIVTGSGNTAKMWDAASGKELLTLKGNSDPVLPYVTFSQAGQPILTGSAVWDAATGKELLALKMEWPSVALSPDGQRIVRDGFNNTAVVSEAATGRRLLTLKGHSDQVSSVAFSPDGRRIVAGGWWNSTAIVWEAASVEQVAVWQKEEPTDKGRKTP